MGTEAAEDAVANVAIFSLAETCDVDSVGSWAKSQQDSYRAQVRIDIVFTTSSRVDSERLSFGCDLFAPVFIAAFFHRRLRVIDNSQA